MKNIKIGIVGAGFIAKEFMENIFHMDGVKVTGIFSNTYEKAVSFAETFNINNVCSSYEELLDSSIDAVYIASHNNSHFEYSTQALNKNKHVLCEKPAGVCLSEFVEMQNLAKEKNLIFMEAMRLLYMPTYLKIKSLLESKIFGEIISINGSLGRISKRTYRHTAKLCGGALLDLGIYPLYGIIDILGLPNDVKSYSLKSEEGVDSTTECLFIYDRQVASMYCSYASKSRGDLRISCEKGTITLPTYFTTTNKIILMDENDNVEELKIDVLGSGMIYEIQHFIDLINKETCNLNDILALKVIGILDKIRLSQDISFPQDRF